MGRITSDLSVLEDMADSLTVTISLAEGETDMEAYDFSEFANVEITGVDFNSLDEIVSDDMVFTHMSGRQQTKEDYFADIASVSGTHVLNANAYGAEGSYSMSGTRWFEKRDGVWYAVNAPED